MIKELLVKFPYEHYQDRSKKSLSFLEKYLSAVILIEYGVSSFELSIEDDSLYLTHSGGLTSAYWNECKNYLLSVVCRNYRSFPFKMNNSEKDGNYLIFSTDILLKGIEL